MFGNKAAQFDASKFNWIGSAGSEVSICVAWHTTGVKTLNDLLTTELTVGSLGISSDLSIFPKVINGVLGTMMKIVHGYPGGNEVMLAVERGELGGRCAWSWSAAKATRKSWIEQKRVNIFVQMALSKHPDLPDVPFVMDLAKTDEDRAIFKLVFARQEFAWPYVAPPGVPADRVAALRKAFMETMKDPAFLADAEKGQARDRADARRGHPAADRGAVRHATGGGRQGDGNDEITWSATRHATVREIARHAGSVR